MISNYILNTVAELYGKKWRIVVLYHLKDGPLRFGQLRNKIPEISVKVLSEVLKDLEMSCLLIRTQYPGIPPKVEYAIRTNAFQVADVVNQIAYSTSHFLAQHADELEIPVDKAIQIQAFLLTME